MKKGSLVYVPEKGVYGFVNEINPDGRIVTIFIQNFKTGKFDLIEVYQLIVETVGLIKRLIVIMKMMFAKPKK